MSGYQPDPGLRRAERHKRIVTRSQDIYKTMYELTVTLREHTGIAHPYTMLEAENLIDYVESDGTPPAKP